MPQHQLTHNALPLAGRTMELRDFSRAAPAGDTNAPLATARLIFTTGALVSRYDWLRERAYLEQLIVEDGAVRLDRLSRGAPLLNTHQGYSLECQIGVVERPRIAKGVGEASVTFSRRPSVAGIVQDVQDGILRGVSVGYIRHKVEMVPPTQEGEPWLYRVTDWTPMEVSIVPIPADADATVLPRSAADTSTREEGAGARLRTFPCDFIEVPADSPAALAARAAASPKGPQMPRASTLPSTVEAEHRQPLSRDEQVSEIRQLVRRHGLADSFADDLVQRNVDVNGVGVEILDELARRDQASGGHRNVSPLRVYPESLVRGGEIEDPLRDSLMVEALTARAGGPAPQRDNPYRHVRVADIARECLEARGLRASGMSDNQLIERALHTTGDFPELLKGTGQRVLRMAYEAAPAGVKRAFRPSTARDFRAKSRLMLSEPPTLLKTNEHGEFKHGSMSEGKSSYALGTYGRIFGITRQALVNDDLNAFGELAVHLGRAAVEFEAQFLVNLLTSNPTMAEDNTVLFHADHGNLASGAGSALSETSLSVARTAMRLQKGLSGQPIDVSPKFLIVPAALETTAEKLLATITPATASTVNPFAGKLELVVDPRLDVVSSTAWYLAGDPVVIDTVEYSYLEGEEGPQVFTDEGFEIDGMQFKVREDFGAGAIDWRGMYKSNGT